MANEIYVVQQQGQVRKQRKITPTLGDVLGFNVTTGKIESRAGAGVAGSPIVSPVVTGSAGTGFSVVKQVTFTEDATSVSHTASVAIPAGATLVDIIIDAGALWGAAAASLTVGDTASTNGYFTATNLKATDLLVGEQLRVSNSTLWGGVNGAYLVAATGRRGPVSSNFGGKYVAGSNIVATIAVTTPAVTTGRTYMTVIYSVGEIVAPVLA